MDCMNYLDKLKNSNGYKLVIHGQIDYMKYKIWKFARTTRIKKKNGDFSLLDRKMFYQD